MKETVNQKGIIRPMHIVFAADQAFVRQLLVASGSAVYACRNGGQIRS